MKPFKLKVLAANDETEREDNLGIDMGAVPDEMEMTFFSVAAVFPCPNNSEHCQTHILSGGSEFTTSLEYSKVMKIINESQSWQEK